MTLAMTARDLDELRSAIGAVPDPEIPVITISDLGVLRSVELSEDRVLVTITPTYSGCPAMHYIREGIEQVLGQADVDGEVRTVLSPAWTTDDISTSGREKLRSYGISPPHSLADVGGIAVSIEARVRCPQCDSDRTSLISEFGSTACKALYKCNSCLEPFDHFKEL